MIPLTNTSTVMVSSTTTSREMVSSPFDYNSLVSSIFASKGKVPSVFASKGKVPSTNTSTGMIPSRPKLRKSSNPKCVPKPQKSSNDTDKVVGHKNKRKMDVIWKDMDSVSLQDMRSRLVLICSHLCLSDIETFFSRMRNILLSFSVVIYEFPQCRVDEKLPSVVQSMIEKHLKDKTAIELCVKLNEGSESNILGVLFKTRKMRKNVLRNAYRLVGTDIRIKANHDFEWIMENY